MRFDRNRPSHGMLAKRRNGHGSGPERRGRLVALGALAGISAGVVLSGCKTDVSVTVRARAEGSGTVRVSAMLDKDAAAWLGSPQNALATKDLAAAGWSIYPIARVGDGGVSIGAEKAFTTVGEGNRAIAELTGTGGPLASLHLSRSRTLVSTSIKLNGKADLSQRLEGFGDDGLKTLVGTGSRIGASEAELVASSGGVPIDKTLLVTLHTDLAGDTKDFPLAWGKISAIAASGRKLTWEAAAGLLGALAGLAALIVVVRSKE